MVTPGANQMTTLESIFGSSEFAPHGWCLLWQRDLLALHVFSDAAIAASYYVIPVALAYFVRRRKDLAFSWIFWMFALFILACGTTHWFGILTIWRPDYWTEGGIKLATAALSVATAVAMWILMPRALAVPTPAQYRAVTSALSTEVAHRETVARALEASEQRFQLLVESITDCAVYSLDLGGVVLDWNRGAERIHGYKADEVIGRNVSMFYTPQARDAGTPVRTLELALAEGRHESEMPQLRRDGGTFLANIVLEPIRDRDGAHIGFVRITRDVTQHRRLEERLRQAEKMEAIGQLTGGVAHDFNNYLMVIINSIDRAASLSRNDPALRQPLEAATRGAERAATLTAQLLAFARKQPLAPKPTDIGRLVGETSELLRRTLGERVRIETMVARDLWPAFCDASQLEGALLNLAVNARDAMPDGGTLTLEVANAVLDADDAASDPDAAPGFYVTIAVGDTGIGMSREVLDRAVDPFFTTKPEGLGTGLGLSQVFGLVKQSGGHMRIRSEPGAGTTVTLYIPKAPSEAATGPGTDDHRAARKRRGDTGGRGQRRRARCHDGDDRGSGLFGDRGGRAGAGSRSAAAASRVADLQRRRDAGADHGAADGGARRRPVSRGQGAVHLGPRGDGGGSWRARAEARPGEQAVPPRRAGAPFAPRVVPCRVQPGLAERA